MKLLGKIKGCTKMASSIMNR